MLKKVLSIFIICLSIILTGCDNQKTTNLSGVTSNNFGNLPPNESFVPVDSDTINENNNQDEKEKRDNGKLVQSPNATTSSVNNDITIDTENQTQNIKEENTISESQLTSSTNNKAQINQNSNDSSVGDSGQKLTKVCPGSVFKTRAEAISYGESHMKYDTSFSVIDYVDECGKMYYELDITFRIQTPGYPKTIDETQVMSFNWNKYDEDTMKYYINNDCSIDVSMSYFGKSEKQKLIEYYNNGYFTKDSKPECYSEIEHELN